MSKKPRLITTFDQYDSYMKSLQSKFPVKDGQSLNLFAFGIAEECGEIMGKLKRRLREGGIDNQEILIEMGDLLGYMSCLADELGSNLTEIAKLNVEKMEKRMSKNSLTGKGDNR